MYLKFLISFMCVVSSARLINAWDLAVSLGNEIQFFYRNGSFVKSVDHRLSYMTALTFDPVRSTFYFSASNSSNHNVFGFHVNNDNNAVGVIEHSITDPLRILGLAVDPVSNALFWTDERENKSGRVMHALLTPQQDAITGTPLFEMNDEEPKGIAVDSCRGMLYWTNTQYDASTIERSTLSGKNRTVIINTDLIHPTDITVDMHSQRIFWCDNRKGIHFRIESADFNGKNRELVHVGTDHVPSSLVVEGDFVFWTDTTSTMVWKKPSIPTDPRSPPVSVIKFKGMSPLVIIANQDLESVVGDCQRLNATVIEKNKTELVIPPFNYKMTSEAQPLFCLRKGSLQQVDAGSNDDICVCPRDVYGNRCESKVCNNYCLNGVCKLDSDGHAQCSCFEGFIGKRCEVDLCTQFCLNDGNCTINNEAPSCECREGFGGNRCEITKLSPALSLVTQPTKMKKTIQNNDDKENNLTINSEDYRGESFVENSSQSERNENSSDNNSDNNTRDRKTSVNDSSDSDVNSNRVESTPEDTSKRTHINMSEVDSRVVNNSNDDFVTSSGLQDCDCLVWSSSPLIAIITCCIFLLFTTFFLAVIHIRRPRIKKRHIVPKNFNPLKGGRPKPSNCEISIETCCNMELCETPCYQSGSLQSNVMGSTCKDEKKSLLINIELNKDEQIDDSSRCMYPDYEYSK